uniref:Cap-specific mRNA (nucleoside-2'-O-)-methyltransferase 1 n=1 Tax=Sinocyclocheilus anshuiensis TaxID=1608454 RepID=A0A671RPY9_9TELE
MKRRAQASDEPLKKRKAVREDSSDEDEESSQRTTNSSQSESLSDVEDHKPSFSRPSNSQNAEGNDASSEASSKFSMYNRVSQKLMAKMGFREGEGLGKFGQGRKEIVETSTQRGRRGLGLTLKGFQGDLNVDWQDETIISPSSHFYSQPSALESVTWFPESSPEIPDADELKDWMTVGQMKQTFSHIISIRIKYSPAYFVQSTAQWKGDVEKAFSAYCIEKKCNLNIGISFECLITGVSGEGGIDGDGDIMRPENITAFRNFVLDSTEGRGLHFLMADGGFSVEGQENIQEILSKQLLLCQFLTAMSAVRPGGHFVCKTFDLFTPFSVGLIYLLYLCFERVSLFKPVTSRPANSERYVVCKSLKPGTDAVREYMFTINLKLNQFRHSDRDVTEVVPLDIIKGDTDFFQFMINSNESHCAVQIKALAKIHAYVRDTTLFEPRQADIRKECLKLWGIPDKARVTHPTSDPKAKFSELVKGSDMDSFSSRPTALNSGNLDKLQHVLDYRCIVGGGEQLFLLGLGRSQIYTWDGKAPLRWKKLENFKLELPRDTLLSVEIVQELKGEGKAQRRINAVHVLDALVLNGTDVRDQHFNQRIQMAEKFVKAVSKPSRPDMNPIRVKEVYRLEEMEKIFVRLEMKVTKSSGGMPRLSYTGRDDRHFLPSGLYIIKTVNDPWTMAFSKSSKRKFFYNKQTKESTYCQYEVILLFWAWEEGVRVHDSQTRVNPDKLSKDDVLSFIHQHCQQ